MSVPLYQSEAEFSRLLGHPVRTRGLEPSTVVDEPAGADVADLPRTARRTLIELPADSREAEVAAR